MKKNLSRMLVATASISFLAFAPVFTIVNNVLPSIVTAQEYSIQVVPTAHPGYKVQLGRASEYGETIQELTIGSGDNRDATWYVQNTADFPEGTTFRYKNPLNIGVYTGNITQVYIQAVLPDGTVVGGYDNEKVTVQFEGLNDPEPETTVEETTPEETTPEETTPEETSSQADQYVLEVKDNCLLYDPAVTAHWDAANFVANASDFPAGTEFKFRHSINRSVYDGNIKQGYVTAILPDGSIIGQFGDSIYRVGIMIVKDTDECPFEMPIPEETTESTTEEETTEETTVQADKYKLIVRNNCLLYDPAITEHWDASNFVTNKGDFPEGTEFKFRHSINRSVYDGNVKQGYVTAILPDGSIIGQFGDPVYRVNIMIVKNMDSCPFGKEPKPDPKPIDPQDPADPSKPTPKPVKPEETTEAPEETTKEQGTKPGSGTESDSKKSDKKLPETGESVQWGLVNIIILTLMAGLSLVLTKRNEEN